MINTSVVDIQKSIVSLLKDAGFTTIYEFNLPKKLTEKVFATVFIGSIRERGQFLFQTFGQCFVHIDIYVKSLSGMEFDSKTMKIYEDKIKNFIITNQKYAISNVQIGSLFVDEQRGYHILKTTLQLTIS